MSGIFCQGNEISLHYKYQVQYHNSFFETNGEKTKLSKSYPMIVALCGRLYKYGIKLDVPLLCLFVLLLVGSTAQLEINALPTLLE